MENKPGKVWLRSAYSATERDFSPSPQDQPAVCPPHGGPQTPQICTVRKRLHTTISKETAELFTKQNNEQTLQIVVCSPHKETPAISQEIVEANLVVRQARSSRLDVRKCAPYMQHLVILHAARLPSQNGRMNTQSSSTPVVG